MAATEPWDPACFNTLAVNPIGMDEVRERLEIPSILLNELPKKEVMDGLLSQ